MAQLNIALAMSATGASQTSSALGGIGRALGGIAQTAAGFVLAGGLMSLPGLLSDAASAAADDEASTIRLNQAIKNLGGDVALHTTQVNAAIEAGQRLGFTDDGIRDSYIKLVAATGDSEEAIKRQAAAMDLARGAGIPLEQASKLLGKITDENVEVFKRMGITIGDNATAADALAAVQEKFGGQADAYAASTKGQMEAASIAFDEMKESLGYAILPLITKLGQVVMDNLPAIQSFVDLLGKGLTVAADLIGKGFDAAFAAIKPFFLVLKSIQAVFDQGGIEGLAETFPAVGQALAVLQPPFEHLVSSLQDLGREISESVQPLVTALGPLFEALAPIVGGILVLAIGGLLQTLGLLIDVFKVVLPIAIDIVVGVINILTTTIQTISTIVGDVVKVVKDLLKGDFAAAWTDAKQLVSDIFTGINNIVTTMTTALGKILTDALSTIGIDWDGFWKTLPDTITTTFNNAAASIQSAGASILDSLIAGMTGAVGGLKTWVTDNIANAIPEWIRSLWDEHSPSGVGIDIGENFIAGILVGMQNKAKDLAGTIGSIAGAAGSALGIGGSSSGFNPPSPGNVVDMSDPQFGGSWSGGWDQAAIYAACGAIAAEGFADYYGKADLTVGGILAAAQKAGVWDEGNGWHGPAAWASFVSNNLGIPAEFTDLAGAIAATSQGKPVAISSPSLFHYLLAQGWNGKEFYVGNTGSNALKGGSAWMSPAAIGGGNTYIRGHLNGGWLTEPILGMGLRTGQLHSFVENGRPEYVSPGGSMPGGAPLEVHVYIGDREITDLVVKTVDKASRTGQLRAVVR